MILQVKWTGEKKPNPGGMFLKKNLPLILVVFGILLMAGAGFFAWQSGQPQPAAVAPVADGSNPHASLTSVGPVADAGGVPQTVANLPLTSLQEGAEAVAAIKQLHGVDFEIVSGKVATYGQSAATLWVAETASNEKALELMTAMKARIDQGGSPFIPVGVFNFRNRDVFMLTGSDGQSNFYMQSGKIVFWVATPPDISEQAMKEMLDFYP